MILECYIAALCWYGLVGWCTAQLHCYLGFYHRYRSIKCWVAWVAIFILWPVTLPMFVEVMGYMHRRDK